MYLIVTALIVTIMSARGAIAAYREVKEKNKLGGVVLFLLSISPCVLVYVRLWQYYIG